MLRKAGTLIEAMFAFNLYMTVIVVFVLCMTSLNRASIRLEKQIAKSYQITHLSGGDELSRIEKLLH